MDEQFDAFVQRIAPEHANLILAEVERLREALVTIRERAGAVCDQYETCHHPACQASYAAWGRR